MENTDLAVQDTAQDALVSKNYAVSLGYYTDPYIRFFAPQTPMKRPPLINRGYWARVQKYREVATSFLQQNSACNIVSIGAGFDTLYWILRQEFENFVYVEVDFEEVTRKKISIIQAHAELAIQGEIGESEITGDSYHLQVGNLRDGEAVTARLAATVDPTKPTLFLTECVLIYMLPEDSDAFLATLVPAFPNSALLTYEMIEPNDAFGRTMLENINARGCPLRGIHKYPTLASNLERFQQWWERVEGYTMLQVYGEKCNATERARVDRIEWFDEFEEWELIQKHYYMLLASAGSITNLKF